MSSFRQIEANRRNAAEALVQLPKKASSVPAAMPSATMQLTAEAVIGALEDAEDYKGFEAAIIADY